MFPGGPNLGRADPRTTSIEHWQFRNAHQHRQSRTVERAEAFSRRQRSVPGRSASPTADPVTRLTRECASLRLKLATERRQYHGPLSTKTPIGDSGMVYELDIAKDEVGRLRIQVFTLEKRCGKLEKLLQEMRDMVRARDRELDRLKKERDRLLSDRTQSAAISQLSKHGRPAKGLNVERKVGKDLINEERASIRFSRQIHGLDLLSMSPTTLAFEEQRARIQGVETFMTKTDTWSGAQIIQSVQDLNSETLQFAASAAELCLMEYPQKPSPARCREAMIATASRLGEGLVRVLSTRNHSQDPILVQFALQAVVLVCTMRCFSSFCVGLPLKPDTFFGQIYLQMRSCEPQPVSSRWRALTHRYIHVLHPRLEEQAVEELADMIFLWCTDVLSTAKCAVPVSSKEALQSRFGAQIRRIVQAACKLARVTKEEIMSTNFELMSVDPGRPYDPEDMIDSFAEYGASRGRVVCIAELGVRCTTIKRSAEGGKAVETKKVLLKPRAIFDSVVQVLDADS
ncbi:hypothetical protein NEOLEDRAFT_1106049 [Neolentinus lepideus HHB14362 ss-1]|uniref:Uncharacterized protein n=1 Tax=Neolentinus lepideus HHB14362 ss-1 TaxID=1314782 RepID=A0A165VFY0_9AGAM|nr:hypothetical protein NEOLEDRAFT_1106049 [Neolentinus lepideus HHB14362 ss-1]